MSLLKQYLEKLQFSSNQINSITDFRNLLKANNLLKKLSDGRIFASYSKTLILLSDTDATKSDEDSRKLIEGLSNSNDSKYSMNIGSDNRIYFTLKEKEVPEKKERTEREETSSEPSNKSEILISSDGTKFKIVSPNEQGYFTIESKKSNESEYSPYPGRDKDKERLIESIKKQVKIESRNKNKIVKIIKE